MSDTSAQTQASDTEQNIRFLPCLRHWRICAFCGSCGCHGEDHSYSHVQASNWCGTHGRWCD